MHLQSASHNVQKIREWDAKDRKQTMESQAYKHSLLLQVHVKISGQEGEVRVELEPEQIFQQFKEVVNGTRKSDSPSSLHSLISRVIKEGSGRDFVAYNFFA